MQCLRRYPTSVSPITRLGVIFAAAALCGISGCGAGSDGGSMPGSALTAIEVMPQGQVLVIDGEMPAVETYTAMGSFADGTVADITDLVAFSVEDVRLGTFDGNTLTTGMAHGGLTRVQARLDDVIGMADVTVRVRQRYADPSVPDLPGDPGAGFNDGDGGGEAPALVYPPDGVLVPPNLRRLELHFYPGADNDLFEIGYSSATTDVKVYTRCTVPVNGGCIYTPDERVWQWIAESNRGGVVQVVVRGTADQAGAVADGQAAGAGTGAEAHAVAASAPISVQIGQDDIRGGIYYWTTSDTSNSSTAIMRFDFASPSQRSAERFIGTEQTGGECVGCHALSRRGDKLVTATGGSYDGRVLLLDVGTRQPLVDYGSSTRSAFSAWSPDGSRFVGVFADERDDEFESYDLNVFDGATGALVEIIDVGGTEQNPTAHPDWSPDGQHIVYTSVGQVSSERQETGTLAYAEQGSVRMVSRDGSGAWAEPVKLTESIEGESTYYPTFSPEGDIIVFNRSICGSGENGGECDGYDDSVATLYAMQPSPDAVPVALAAANRPGPTDELEVVQSSYPKWSPFTFRKSGERGDRLHWLTFSSDRNYGLRKLPDDNTLIWMAAVDPDAVIRGEGDPSFPAFALPFQDLETDNHTAQWAEQVFMVE